MSTNPYVSAAVAEAQSIFGWAKAQVMTLWASNKTAVIVIAASAFLLGRCA